MIGPHLRAVILALVYGIFFLLATPGLDGVPRGFLNSQAKQDRLAETVPSSVVWWMAEAMEINRNIRIPLTKILAPLQPPLRLEQTWRLYGDGPPLVRKMVILVDDEPVYRSEDSELNWRESAWRMRRLRPMPATIAGRCRRGNQPVNRIGFSRLVTEWALEDFPGAQRVEVRIIAGRYPGETLRATHGLVREAPDWKLEDVQYRKGPCP